MWVLFKLHQNQEMCSLADDFFPHFFLTFVLKVFLHPVTKKGQRSAWKEFLHTPPSSVSGLHYQNKKKVLFIIWPLSFLWTPPSVVKSSLWKAPKGNPSPRHGAAQPSLSGSSLSRMESPSVPIKMLKEIINESIKHCIVMEFYYVPNTTMAYHANIYPLSYNDIYYLKKKVLSIFYGACVVIRKPMYR